MVLKLWNAVKQSVSHRLASKGSFYLSSLLVLSLTMTSSIQAFAVDSQGTSQLDQLGQVDLEGLDNPKAPGVLQYLDKKQLFRHKITGLIPYRQDDLNGRQPLVLVHGIGGTEGTNLSEWGDFITYTNQIPEFQKHFKVYLFHYNSAESVPRLSAGLQQDLADFLKTIPSSQKIKIVGYSEGGLLVRNAMQSPLLNRRVEQVITMATPFHGSPLASKSWFTAQVCQESWLAPLRLSRKVAYWVTEKKHPSFENDFHWDNVDEAIDKTFLMDKVPTATDYELQRKPNFITYGSFFGTPDAADEQMVKSLALNAPLPSERHGVQLGKRMIFNIVNQSIGRIGRIVKQSEPEAKPSIDTAARIQESHVLLAAANQAIEDASIPEPEQATDVGMSTISMMPFNDGISPISSSLWLGRFSQQSTEKDPSKRLWSALRSLKGKDKARLFPGLDHRNWIEGQTRMSSNLVPDLLNPQRPAKSVFDWLISDLMATN